MKTPVTRIVPPKSKTLLSGVVMVDIYPSSFVRLHYWDASTEGCNLARHEIAECGDDVFKFKDTIQSKRPDTLRFDPRKEKS